MDNRETPTGAYWDYIFVRKYASTQPAPTPQSEELSPGPIAYWKFDEGSGTNTYDSSSNNFTGTISGSANYLAENQCIAGKCLNFNGSSYINAGNPSNFRIQNNSITIETWVNFSYLDYTNNTGTLISLIGKGHPDTASGTPSSGFWLTYDNRSNRNTFNYTCFGNTNGGYAGGGNNFNNIQYNFETNKWYHIAITISDNQGKFYLNGKQTGTTKIFSNLNLDNTTHDLYLAKTTASNHNGLLDELKIYPYARTADQIKQDYNSRGSLSGAGVNLGVQSNTAPSLKSKLIAHWKFDERNGTKVNNYITNGIGLSGILGIANSTPTWSEGKINSGLNFLKSNINKNTVYINDDNSLDQLDDTSISTWFKSSNQPINNSSYKVLVIYQGASGHNLEDKYVSEGYNVTVDLGATTIATVASHQPDIVVCDRYVWGCSESFLNTLYNQGYNIASQGNDTTTTILPILSIVSAGGTASGTITPDEKHPIASGWSSTGNSGSDGRYGITSINSRAFSIAKDQTNNWTEVVYLEEPDKGRWVHYQTNASPDTTLFDNSNTFLLRSNLISKGKNYNLFLYKNNLYGWLNNQGINTSMTPNNWNHVNLNYNLSNIYLYLNGNLRNSLSYSTNLDVDNSNLYLGNFLDGSLDEAKIYNRALTDEEVKQDYNAGSAIQFGSTSQSIGGTTTSLEYCIPGDTSYCASPIAEWKMDEGVGTSIVDTSSNNNTGTLGAGNSSPTWTQGKIGKGLNFDGASNKYISISNNINIGPSSWTISGWVKIPSSTVGRVGNFFGNFSDSPNLNLEVYTSGEMRYYWNGEINQLGTTNLKDDKWHYITWIRDKNSNSGYMYIDGKLEKSFLGAGSDLNFTTPFWIGSDKRSGGLTWHGQIDHVLVYNYARTPAQIAYDYNKGGPIGWWKFDECQGSTAYDWSGNQNNGTIIIGSGGFQNSLGTCAVGTSAAWTNGSVGKINSSLNFDGSDDYISVADSSQLKFGLNNFSISTWIKAPPSQTNFRYIIIKTGGSRYSIETNGNNWFWRLDDDQSHVAQTTISKTILDNSWHMITIVIDRTNQKVYSYSDGLLSASPYDISILTGNISPPNNLYFGGTSYFNGQIDDVRIYNYALTSEQVKQVYNGGAVNFR